VLRPGALLRSLYAGWSGWQFARVVRAGTGTAYTAVSWPRGADWLSARVAGAGLAGIDLASWLGLVPATKRWQHLGTVLL